MYKVSRIIIEYTDKEIPMSGSYLVQAVTQLIAVLDRKGSLRKKANNYRKIYSMYRQGELQVVVLLCFP